MGRSGFIVVAVAAMVFTLACKSSSGGGGGTGAGTGGTSPGGSGGSGASGSSASGSGGTGSGGSGGSAMAGTGGGMVFDAGTALDRNMVKPGAVCARLAAIQCAGEVFCCTAPKETVDACVKSATMMCNGSASLDVVSKAAAVGFDPTASSAAFTELERRASKCDPSIAAWAISTDGFQRSFTGTLASGADCTPMGGFMGSTGDIAIALASCRLADGLACLPGPNMTDKWMCAARAANAGRCYTDLNCQEGLYCDNPQATPMGKCAARKAAGMACNSEVECTSVVCKGGKCAAADDVQAAYCFK
jgi:Dickkopf N-terminal cysteine-rich region